nr:uncharacterized protein LOC113709138 [Coffea arabica]
MPKKVLFLTEMVGYDELLDRVYNIMGLDRNRQRINLIFRNCPQPGIFGAMPLVDDNGVAGMYYLKSGSRQPTEIYVKVEEISNYCGHDSQTFEIGSGIQAEPPYHLFDPTNLHHSQLTQVEAVDDLPSRTGRRKGNMRCREIDRPTTSSRPSMHKSTIMAHAADIPTSSMLDPLPYTDIDLVDVEIGSEPEPDDDNSGSDDDQDDVYPVHSIQARDQTTFAEPFLGSEGPSLRYEAGVDAILQFDPLDTREAEKLKFWSERTKELELGQLFETKEHIKRAVKLWSIKENREFKVRASTPTTWFVRCRARNSTPPCNWQLRATLRASHKMWMIVSLTPGHTCVRVCNTNDHRGLSADLIAQHIIPHILNGPLYKVKEIQTSVKKEFHVDVTYKKAWYARRRAIDIVYGDWPTSISQLPTYVDELQLSNPGTVVVWDHHPLSTVSQTIFDYIFWAFAPAIQAFRHLKPVICVDGTFLKGPYRGKLLVAIGFDACNHLFPLAFALVDEENNRSWSWFMRLLRIHVCRDVQNVCVISDRHHGIIHAMRCLEEWKEPLGVHRFCLVHIRSNFTQKFRNERLKSLMWGAGKANQTRKYEDYMSVIFSISPEAYAWLTGGSVRPEQWALCKDGGYRWGHATTNMAECFNNLLRESRFLPITALIRYTFNQTVDLFVKNHKMAWDQVYHLPLYGWEKYVANEQKGRAHSVQVFDHRRGIYCITTAYRQAHIGGHAQTVDIGNRTCTCGKWRELRFPCSHAIAAYFRSGLNPMSLVGPEYTFEAYQATYESPFNPLRDPKYWPVAELKLSLLTDRLKQKAPGPLKTSRIRNEMDRKCPDAPRRCTNCLQPGHTAPNCPFSGYFYK